MTETELLTKIEILKDDLRVVATAIALGNASKIHAIKAWRAATGAPLKEAKDYIESIAARAERSQEGSRIQRVEDRLTYLERRTSALEQASAVASTECQAPRSDK